MAPDAVPVLRCSSKFSLNPGGKRLAEKALCMVITSRQPLLLAVVLQPKNAGIHKSGVTDKPWQLQLRGVETGMPGESSGGCCAQSW